MNHLGDRPVRAWIGLAVGTLGVVLIAGAAAVTIHASDAPRFDAGEKYQVTGSGPIHVVTIGSVAATCELTGSAGLESIEVPARRHPLDSIPAGRHLWAELGATLTCDRPAAVAASPRLFAGYATLAILGLLYFVRHRPGRLRGGALKSDAPTPASPGMSTGPALSATVSRAVAARPEPPAVVDPTHGTNPRPT